MVDFGDALPLLLLLALALLLLGWLSRQVSLTVQRVVYYVTGNVRLPAFILFLILLPGIFLHESAHWVAARVLGLKTGHFRVWPKIQGKSIGMGSVAVQRGALWQDSLVGLAPLLAGTALIALIGDRIFATDRLTGLLAQGELVLGLAAFWAALDTADGALWAYLVFAIANAMMPSPSDREPLKPLLTYVALLVIVYLILGLPSAPFADLLERSTPLLALLTSALLFTILLDGLVIAGLALLELFVRPRMRVAVPSARRRR
jgi:multisubunit Na+/H+ antiporter MnhB subunit